MKDNLSDSQLLQMSEIVSARMGLYFPRERWRDLERHTNTAAKEFGFTDAEAFLQWLVSSPLTQEQIETLASQLTIAETYFWREPQVFEALRDQILPELISSRKKGEKRLRIWSAGCATGEEPYSIAIALRQALPVLKDWYITLLATDINPRILKRAETGVYRAWSFRNEPPGFKEKYFIRNDDGKFEIRAEIREMVTFNYLNLAEDIYPSPLNNTNAMDLIFCRNVLMYFEPERARQVGQNLYRSLVQGGWLVVSASELSQQLFSQFDSVHFPGAIVYSREIEKSRPQAIFPRTTVPAQKISIQLPLESTTQIEQATHPPKPPKSEMAQAIESKSPQPAAVTKDLDHNVQGHSDETREKPGDETTPTAVATIVRALANQGKLSEALTACEGAITADRLNPSLHYLYAAILQEQNQEGEAMAALKRALYLDPNFVLAHFALGNLAQRQGNTAVAIKSFNNVLALLRTYGPQDSLPEAEGLTASRLREIVQSSVPPSRQEYSDYEDRSDRTARRPRD